MASKRTHNVSSRIYSFSEEDSLSEEEIQPKRRRLQASGRSRRYMSDSVNKAMGVNISSTCVKNLHNGNMNKGGLPIHHKEMLGAKKQTCYSRNAILARENRIKKKIYLDSLENQISSLKTENKKIRTTLGTQASYITDLETEIRYLRSVLSNSKEIGMLLSSVRTSTGLPISTSLQQSLDSDGDLRKTIPYKRTIPAARKTAWPYDSVEPEKYERHIPTPPTSTASMSPLALRDDPPLSPFNVDVSTLFSDDDLPIAIDDVGLAQFSKTDDMYEPLSLLSPIPSESSIISGPVTDYNDNVFQDHTYTSKLTNDRTDTFYESVGVCLHISNKKVSLEFCSKCNEKGHENWNAVAY